MEKELSDKEKKHYLNILIENTLFERILATESSEKQEKKEKDEIINRLIEKFYEEYKDYYGISCIEEVIAKIEEIKTAKYAISHPEEEER